jgi:hypothetical protein
LGALPREATRGNVYIFTGKDRTIIKEIHGAIDRKRGVKTPTKA